MTSEQNLVIGAEWAVRAIALIQLPFRDEELPESFKEAVFQVRSLALTKACAS